MAEHSEFMIDLMRAASCIEAALQSRSPPGSDTPYHREEARECARILTQMMMACEVLQHGISRRLLPQEQQNRN